MADGWSEILRANGLVTVDDFFDCVHDRANDQVLTKPGLESWRERIRLSLDLRGDKQTVYLKRYSSTPRSVQRAVGTGGSGATTVAGVEWAWMQRLADDGVACARPIALAEERDPRGRERRSALLMESVGGRSLESRLEGDELNEAAKRRIASLLAVLIGRLHRKGYVHRDLYPCHVFFDPAASDVSCLTLIDLQRIFRPGVRRYRWIVKDLSALNYGCKSDLCSRTLRLRFLKEYLLVGKVEIPMKALAYRILGKTRQIGAHDRRRNARYTRETKS